MKITKRAFFATIALIPFAMFAGMNSAKADDMGAEHKVVIQISSGNPADQKLALNNAVNVSKSFGPGEVAIEVVAYGPGLSVLTKSSKNKEAQRVASLAKSDITFSACGNTMKAMEKKTGKKPVLIDGVKVVPAGVVRIMELQKQGYAYIRP
jgi:intracellular sulfur oxidation DsrE/DsrF family protein